MKPVKRTELSEPRKARLSTRFAPKVKIFGPVSVKVEFALEIKREAKAIYQDGDCLPDDPHDIWDRMRMGQ